MRYKLEGLVSLDGEKLLLTQARKIAEVEGAEQAKKRMLYHIANALAYGMVADGNPLEKTAGSVGSINLVTDIGTKNNPGEKALN